MQPNALAEVRSKVEFMMVACVLAVACNSSADRNASSGQGVSSVDAARLTASLHERLVDEAEHKYSWGDYKPSIPVPNGTLDHSGGVPDLHAWARKMTYNDPTDPEVHHFVGLIYSDKQYKKLGMGRNENYLLELSNGGTVMYVMVPSDLKIPMTVLDYDRNSSFNHSSSVAHDPPQVVHEVTATRIEGGNRIESLAIGGCVEGPCPTGHCGIGATGEEFTYTTYINLKPSSKRP